MKKLFISLIIFTNCVHAQSGSLGYNRAGVTPTPPTSNYNLIIFSGESNSGGQVLNSGATVSDKLPKLSVQILNNNSFLFENLSIGVNNNIGHNGIPNGTTHGWELGLANSVDSGTLPTPIYLVKTGQGGSSIKQWAGPDTSLKFYDSLTNRVDAAKSILSALNSGTAPRMALFYSQGINDGLYVASDSANWKTRTKAHLARVRTRYGSMPIFITYLPAAFSIYNTYITQICTEITDCYAVQTSDASMMDAYHWSYSGMKLIAARMVAAMKLYYSL